MTPADASRRKVRGHRNERAFAELIGGEVSRALQTDKRDVLDQTHRFHSVKSGEWWQIFLYARSRFETNTVFQGLGALSELMIACLDAFPENYEDYRADRTASKLRLQTPMRSLREELGKPGILPAFFEKSLFNAGEVQYLTILPANRSDAPDHEKEFHIFDRQDVVRTLCSNLEITNSKARNANQTDDQKVLFRISGRNCGEIEVRTDSAVHHRQAKFRLNGTHITQLLIDQIGTPNRVSPQLLTYGRAGRTFRL